MILLESSKCILSIIVEIFYLDARTFEYSGVTNTLQSIAKYFTSSLNLTNQAYKCPAGCLSFIEERVA